MAKIVIIFISALFASEYDIDIHRDSIEFTKDRYGLGVREIKGISLLEFEKRPTSLLKALEQLLRDLSKYQKWHRLALSVSVKMKSGWLLFHLFSNNMLIIS